VRSALASSELDLGRLASLQAELGVHPLYEMLGTVRNLAIFMEHHVFAVWDFMSLIKSLQRHIAPTAVPWLPPLDARAANFINQLVLEEESDHALADAGGVSHASHFESYRQAMVEVGANSIPITRFLGKVREDGIQSALLMEGIPEPARQFMKFTFEVIEHDQPHLLAVLAYGRESLVPQLFRSILEVLKLRRQEAPVLCAYLERHIELDEQEHAPLANYIVQTFCKGSHSMQAEAMDIAAQALQVRLDFWDGIHQALSS
jgi:hypothetical protein